MPAHPCAERPTTSLPEQTGVDATARLVETHTAILFFIGDRVYKLKKPVDFGFLDFRLLATRRTACEAEVELNSRLSPDVYLGVADVVAPDGQPLESLVVMRRMPNDRRLSTIVTTHPESPLAVAAIRTLARLIADFHSRSTSSSEITACADPEAVRGLWRDNLASLRSFAGEVVDEAEVDRIERLALDYLDGREPLLRQRQLRGQIRDGHGDLQADDIFILDDGPRVLDCLEFDARLRCGDVLNDVAFLAMDLERLGAPEAARSFLDAYQEFSGEHNPQSLEDHYVAYRAGVRSKVACLRWSQGDQTASTVAQNLMTLAASHLRRSQVALVLVGGLPGTGKSTVATALASPVAGRRWTLLRSDVIRKALAGLPPTESAAAAYDAGLYEPRSRRRVYDELFRRAELALGYGENVIIDATFADPEDRATAGRIAARTHTMLIELECQAPLETVTPRLATRAAQGSDPSDADLAIWRKMSSTHIPWRTAKAIDTSPPLAGSVATAKAAVESALT